MARVIGFAGFSDSGKTTMITKLTAILKQRGYTVAVMKHDAHGHYKEVPGTDSGQFHSAGADTVITVSPGSVHRYDRFPSFDYKDLLMSVRHADVVLIEGFKSEHHPKIAVFRTMEQSEIMSLLQPAPIAIITDLDAGLFAVPVFKPDEAVAISEFILRQANIII